MFRFAIVAATLVVFAVSPASAGERFAVGVYAGTPGVGADIQIKTVDVLVLRAGGHYLDFNVDGEYDGIDYDTDVNGSNAFLTADLHPFKNGFFLSGGAIIGEKSVDFVSAVDEPVEIGDLIFTPDQVGTLVGRSEARDVAPFVGLGFDNALTNSGRLGFHVLLGAAFTGDPSVELNSVGGAVSDDPLLQMQLEAEEEDLRDELDDFSIYPVGRIGLSVSF